MVTFAGRSLGSAALFSFLFLACLPVGPKLGNDEEDERADGAVCDNGNQCKSGSCLDDLCSGSGGCEGDGDCNAGWKCVHVPGSSGLFTSSSAHEECKPLCSAGCPEHFKCVEGDEYCTADGTWSQPQVTITPSGRQTVHPGATMKFHAEATSPIGANDLTFEWSFTDAEGSSQRVVGPDIELTAYRGGSVWSATVTVTDGKSRRGSANAELAACGEAGAQCFSDATDVPCCGSLSCQSFSCQ